jgi:hypothetical protein
VVPDNVEQLWDAIGRIGSDDPTDKIAPEVVAKLIQFKLVELKATGLSQLTARGESAYVALECGDDADDFPELEAPTGRVDIFWCIHLVYCSYRGHASFHS